MTRKITLFKYLLLAGCVGFHANALAVSTSGFISVGGGKASESSDYPDESDRTYRPAEYEQYSDKLRFGDSTILGLQFGESLSDKTYLTAQLITRGAEGYNPELSWAFLRHEITANTEVSIGRFSAPFYTYSESIDVGFTYLWIRPPADAYRVDIKSMDGIKLRHRMKAGSGYFDFEVFRGEGEEETIKANEFSGLTATYSWEWLTLRAQYSLWDMDWLQNPRTREAIDDPIAQGLDYKYKSFSAQIEYENFIILSELMYLDAANFRGRDYKTESSYITLGYRYGALTPHFTYTQFERTLTGLQDLGITTLGLRWDTDYGFALKLEYLQRENKTADFSLDNVDVLAFSIDAVF